jgi:hypothetical protein
MTPNGEFTDTVLLCVDCKSEFIWTSGEQLFFHDKGFTEPKRCKPCRDKKKAARATGAAMTALPGDRVRVQPVPFYDKDQEERDNAKDNRRRRRRGF